MAYRDKTCPARLSFRPKRTLVDHVDPRRFASLGGGSPLAEPAGGRDRFSAMRDMGWFLGVLGVVAGCAATLPAVPGKGGPPWLELTSEHFTVLTDADQFTASGLMRQLEQVHQVLVGVAFPAAARGRILVFALRDDEELSL